MYDISSCFHLMSCLSEAGIPVAYGITFTSSYFYFAVCFIDCFTCLFSPLAFYSPAHLWISKKFKAVDIVAKILRIRQSRNYRL